DGADEIGRARRDDLFLAGDERDRAGAVEGNDPVVVVARKQPERKSDHPGAVTEHARDDEMGLAGIRPRKGREGTWNRGESAHWKNIGVPAPKGKWHDASPDYRDFIWRKGFPARLAPYSQA